MLYLGLEEPVVDSKKCSTSCWLSELCGRLVLFVLKKVSFDLQNWRKDEVKNKEYGPKRDGSRRKPRDNTQSLDFVQFFFLITERKVELN